MTGCTGLGSIQRIWGAKPSWRAINDTEAAPYGDRPQCMGLGVDVPAWAYACGAIVGSANPCYDLAFVHHLDELDGCVQLECVLVPTTDNLSKELCGMWEGLPSIESQEIQSFVENCSCAEPPENSNLAAVYYAEHRNTSSGPPLICEPKRPNVDCGLTDFSIYGDLQNEAQLFVENYTYQNGEWVPNAR